MSLPISVTYTFATATSSIPLSQLDANFTTVVNGINGIGNGTNALANVNITGGNATVSSLTSPTLNSSTTLSLQTGGTTGLYIDGSQNVGIGTSSPQQKLDVRGNLALGPAGLITGSLSGTTTGSLNFSGGTAFNTGGASISLRGITNGYNNGGIEFYTGAGATGSEVMRIDSSGNVGIGTSSPIEKFEVSAATRTYLVVTGQSYNANQEQGLHIRAYTDATHNSDWYIFQNPVGTSGGLAFTNYINNGSGAVGGERMRIDSSGNLLVGTTSSTVTNGGIFNQTGSISYVAIGHANGTASGNWYVNFQYAGTTIGTIAQNGTTAVAYNTSSDYRLKENVTPMTTSLATVNALKPVTYDWISDKSKGEGFIAHELQTVIPLAVTGEKDALDEKGKIKPQGVDYSKIVVHLVAALQELDAKFEAYKASHP